MFSRWPVRSASTRLDVFLARIDQPADERHDQGDDAGQQQPAAEDEADEQRRRRARRGSAGTTARACGRRAAARRGRRPAAPATVARTVVVVDAQALGQPVEQRQDRARSRRGRGSARRRRARAGAGTTPDRREDRRERRPGHVDPGRRRWRGMRRAAAPGRRRRREPAERPRCRTNTMRIAMPTGRSAMSLPQSGVTNWAMISRIEVQIRSSIGRPASARADARGAGHSLDDPATRT